jgi:hypothetical protein
LRAVSHETELLFEIHHAWPEINSESVQSRIDERDRRAPNEKRGVDPSP